MSKNGAYVGLIVTYKERSDGKYDLTVKSGSAASAKVSSVAKDGVATYVFISAPAGKVDTSTSTDLLYVFDKDDKNQDKDGNLIFNEAALNGEKGAITVSKDATSVPTANSLYQVKINSDGEVTEALLITHGYIGTTAGSKWIVGIVIEAKDGTIKVGSTGYNYLTATVPAGVQVPAGTQVKAGQTLVLGSGAAVAAGGITVNAGGTVESYDGVHTMDQISAVTGGGAGIPVSLHRIVIPAIAGSNKGTIKVLYSTDEGTSKIYTQIGTYVAPANTAGQIKGSATNQTMKNPRALARGFLC